MSVHGKGDSTIPNYENENKDALISDLKSEVEMLKRTLSVKDQQVTLLSKAVSSLGTVVLRRSGNDEIKR